ncbi:hypothetical protein [Amycolatopsis sp. NPDC059657]|uniref:hypothetical protein n=1 Tax=Amycolatopsis sp. NPDC059657 TaxID=3346899 RepID=UPI003671D835
MVRFRDLVLVVIAFAAVGCGPDVPAAAPATTSGTPALPTTTGASAPTTISATPPSTPPTTSSVALPPFPLDGTNLKSCEDGECEVRVKRNATINAGAGRPTFKVVKISSAGVDFQLRYPDGKRATLTLGPEDGSYAGFGEPMSFKISLESVDDDGTAVLEVGPLKGS